MIDAASVLSVTLTYGDLFSVTQLAMLGGRITSRMARTAAGEIIAAQTCTLITGKSYTLQNLLRGRFGTGGPWACMRPVMHSCCSILPTWFAISVSSGAIGLSSLYRGITADRDISLTATGRFAYQTVNLKPLSPVSLSGNRDASNDWSLTWVRRARTGGEWRDCRRRDWRSVEQYQIDVFADGTYTTVKRTISLPASQQPILAPTRWPTSAQTRPRSTSKSTGYRRPSAAAIRSILDHRVSLCPTAHHCSI